MDSPEEMERDLYQRPQLAIRDDIARLLPNSNASRRHDDAIRQIVATIRELMNPPEPPRKRGKIGFGWRIG